MKLRNVNALAKSKVKRYRCRTLLMVVPTSLFFGVIMALLLVLASLKVTLQKQMDAVSSDTYFATYIEGSQLDDLKDRVAEMKGEVIFEDRKSAGVEADYLTLGGAMREEYLDAMQLNYMPEEIVKPFVVAEHKQSQVPILVDLKSAARIAGVSLGFDDRASLEKVQQAAVGEEFSLDKCMRQYDEQGNPMNLDGDEGLKCEGEINYKIVGILPGFRTLKENRSGFFDMVLSGASSGEVQHYILAKETQEFRRNYKVSNDKSYDAIVKFASTADADKFMTKYSCSEQGKGCDIYPNTWEYFGNRSNIETTFRDLDKIFVGLFVVLMVVAMVAFAVSVTKIMDDESQKMKLYRSVGASLSDIKKIYFSYVMKVVLYTLVIATALSLVIATIIFAVGHNTLTNGLVFMYGRPETGISYAVDWRYALALFAIVLSGLVGYICSLGKMKKASR